MGDKMSSNIREDLTRRLHVSQGGEKANSLDYLGKECSKGEEITSAKAQM